LMCFDVNAHSVSLMGTLGKGEALVCFDVNAHRPCWVVQQAANGGLLHDPIVDGVRTKKRTEPETVV